MVFASTTFIYFFLPATLVVYYGLLRKSRYFQNIFLTFASLFFYAWGEPRFVMCMLFSIFANWGFGKIVDNYKTKNQNNNANLIVGCAIFFNLAILFVFKYLNFFFEILNDILGMEIVIPEISLPIGISFFIFQAMSYVIDIYRNRGKCQHNIMNVGLYIACFPQLIAGPIVRYETVAYEIEHRHENWDDFLDGFSRFIVGLAKKVLIANTLSVYADFAFTSVETLSVASSWLGAICYTFQIYYDFSGYSDMAIGLGKMFGFHYLENFNYPYISKSITEFWRRWHISLGSWFRDYVYIPLGGSRVSKTRRNLNLLCVWLLTGIWHGANWTFILWGLMYFFLLVLEKSNKQDRAEPPIRGFLKWIKTMLLVMIGWVVFRANSIAEAVMYIKSMAGFNYGVLIDNTFIDNFGDAWIILLIATVFSAPTGVLLQKKIKECSHLGKLLYQGILGVLFFATLVSIVSSEHNPFIYFNF